MKAISNLTPQEEAVLAYIEKYPREVLVMSIKQLAKASYTSAATVVRLCQKAGFKGYSSFKYTFASELPNILKLSADLKVNPLQPGCSPTEVFQQIGLVHRRSIEYTQSLLDKQEIARIASLIKASKRIEIYGEGLNYELARQFCLEFEEVGCVANAYNSLNPMSAELSREQKVPVLAFILTHTGNNEHMYSIARSLQEKNYHTVVICDSAQRRICKICDAFVVIMTTKGTLELSNSVYISSLQYLFDAFVSLKMIADYQRIKRISTKVDQEKKED